MSLAFAPDGRIEKASPWVEAGAFESEDRAWLPILGLALVIGTTFRLLLVVLPPLWLDESLQWRDSLKPWAVFVTWKHNSLHAPLSFMLTKLAMTVFGTWSEPGLRTPSLLFGITNIFLAYRLGVSLSGRFVGVLAGALFSLDPLLIEFDSAARMYSIWLTATFLVLEMAIRIDEELSAGRSPGLGSWIALGGVSGLAFWCHSVGLMAGAAALSCLLVRHGLPVRRRAGSPRPVLGGILVSGLTVLLVSLPGLLKMLDLVGRRRVREAGADTGVSVGVTLAGSIGTRYYGVVFVAALFGLYRLWKDRPGAATQLLFLALFSVLPIALGRGVHFLTPRYLYPFVLPVIMGLAISIATGLGWLSERVAPRSQVGAKLLMIAILLSLGGVRSVQASRKIFSTVGTPIRKFEGARLIRYVAARTDERDQVMALSPWLLAHSYFYRLKATRVDPGLWSSGFGYDLDSIHIEPGTSLWVVIETTAWNQQTSVTEGELARVLAHFSSDRAFPVARRPNLVRIGDGVVTAYQSGDLWTGDGPFDRKRVR